MNGSRQAEVLPKKKSATVVVIWSVEWAGVIWGRQGGRVLMEMARRRAVTMFVRNACIRPVGKPACQRPAPAGRAALSRAPREVIAGAVTGETTGGAAGLVRASNGPR